MGAIAIGVLEITGWFKFGFKLAIAPKLGRVQIKKDGFLNNSARFSA
jgi:hypothetical protein